MNLGCSLLLKGGVPQLNNREYGENRVRFCWKIHIKKKKKKRQELGDRICSKENFNSLLEKISHNEMSQIIGRLCTHCEISITGYAWSLTEHQEQWKKLLPWPAWTSCYIFSQLISSIINEICTKVLPSFFVSMTQHHLLQNEDSYLVFSLHVHHICYI